MLTVNKFRSDNFSFYRIIYLTLILSFLVSIFAALKGLSYLPDPIIINTASKLLRGSIYMEPNGEIPRFVVTNLMVSRIYYCDLLIHLVKFHAYVEYGILCDSYHVVLCVYDIIQYKSV